MTLAVVSLLWDANRQSAGYSSMYDESWVEKLYAGFARNLTRPFEFILYTDRLREYAAPVTQILLPEGEPNYGWCILPYGLGRPMILVGLDTVVTGNIDHLADYCLTADHIACPLDPYYPHQVCNGVALVPAGWERVAERWSGENDMVWIRTFAPDVIDTLFPGQVVSYKGQVRKNGLGDARLVFFHGEEKPHQLAGVDWIEQHWNGDHMAEPQKTDPRSGNHPGMLPGEVIPHASGWKAREMAAERRLRKRTDAEEHEKIRAARAALYAASESAPLVSEAQAEGGAPVPDSLSAMKWDDLRALYELTLGKKPGAQMKRVEVEAAIREAGKEAI